MLFARTLRTMPGQIAGPLAQMAAAVAFTHYLSPDELGVYAIAWAAQELAYYGVLAWWSMYVQRHALADTDTGRLNGAESAVQAGAAVLQAMVAALGVWLVLDRMPDAAFLASVAAFTVTRNLGAHFAARARSEGAVAAFTLLQFIGPGGGLALGIAAANWVAPTAEVLLLAYAVAQALALIVALPFMRYQPARPRIDAAMLRASWIYGAPLILANLFEWGANHGVRLVVEFDLGPEGVGLLTTAWWLGLRIAAFVALLVTGATFFAAVSRLEKDGPDAARAQLSDSGALLLAILAPAMAGGALLAAPFAALTVAEPFRAATATLLPLALLAGSLKAFREHAPEQAFLVFGHTRAAVLTALVEMVLTLGGCAIGLLLGGLTGALIGCAAASLAGTIFSYVLAMRLTGYAIRPSDALKIVVATVAMSGVVAILPAATGFVGFAIAVLAGVAVYGAASLLLWRDQLPLRAARTRISPAPSATGSIAS